MFPILFRIGNFTVPSYGVLVAAGWVLGILWCLREVKHMPLRGGERDAWHFIYAAIVGALIGGKLLALVAYLPSVGLYGALMNLRAGFVYLGGLMGAWALMALMGKIKGYRTLPILDFVAAPHAFTHGIGRLGCLGAGCCFGSPTSLPWGIRFTNPSTPIPPELLGVPLHPTQVLEAVGHMAIALVLYFGFRPRVIAGQLRPGVTWLAHIIMYGTLRFLLDFLRGDDPDFVMGPLTASQAMSVVLVAGSLLYLRHLRNVPAVDAAPARRRKR